MKGKYPFDMEAPRASRPGASRSINPGVTSDGHLKENQMKQFNSTGRAASKGGKC